MLNFIFFIWLIFIIACLLEKSVNTIIYKQTTYYKITHKSLSFLKRDIGSRGEYLIYKYLRKFEADGAKFLFNCYIPKNNGQTTEVDVIMIHSSGLYVFESKNYSGWIFGSETSKTWTQTLPAGSKSHKYRFFNPIMQNNTHIKELKSTIGDSYPIHSVIVFSERCVLKKIDLKTSNISVINRNKVKQTVEKISYRTGVQLSMEHINEIYTKLYPYTQVTDETKQKHIESIKNSYH